LLKKKKKPYIKTILNFNIQELLSDPFFYLPLSKLCLKHDQYRMLSLYCKNKITKQLILIRLYHTVTVFLQFALHYSGTRWLMCILDK